jgi:hypothetical protein
MTEFFQPRIAIASVNRYNYLQESRKRGVGADADHRTTGKEADDEI